MVGVNVRGKCNFQTSLADIAPELCRVRLQVFILNLVICMMFFNELKFSYDLSNIK